MKMRGVICFDVETSDPCDIARICEIGAEIEERIAAANGVIRSGFGLLDRKENPNIDFDIEKISVSFPNRENVQPVFARAAE